MDPFWTALALTTFAGLATVLGGVLAIVGREPSGRGLGAALGLAAGVMLAVSFLEMLPASVEGLGGAFGPAATAVAVAALILGAGSYVLLERAVPDPVSGTLCTAIATASARPTDGSCRVPAKVTKPSGRLCRPIARAVTVPRRSIRRRSRPAGSSTSPGISETGSGTARSSST